MTDRPVLFSSAMVRALLDGRKTQTRRLVDGVPPAPQADCHPQHQQRHPAPYLDSYCGAQKTAANPRGMSDRWCWWQVDDRQCLPTFKVPYVPGDRLWVKERWAEEHPLALQDGRFSLPGHAGIPGPPPVQYRVIYMTDGEPLQVWRSEGGHPYFTLKGPADDIAAKHPTVCSNYARKGKGVFWNRAQAMPRWASRLTLHVTAVKVERLQDISEEDAIAEGVDAVSLADVPRQASRRQDFSRLWESLHGPGSWDQNPWVAAISFTVIKANIDAPEAQAA